ncbi:MAG TPA: DUF6051 family protein [Bacteroidales bacterium]|nr:DUF6051 family protein [Bacteroidales bacterium]
MDYKSDYHYLRNITDNPSREIDLYQGEYRLHRQSFVSENCHILPGEDHYSDQGITFQRTPDFRHAISPEINEILNLADSKVRENRYFDYIIFKPAFPAKARGIIMMFHGLNEKNWDKYLVWARQLMQRTGKAVVLFPIAFHMNRSPEEWSHTRLMNGLKNVRQGFFPAVVASSFANVAISTRLHILPQRFFWSGVLTFWDVVQLINQIRAGQHPLIHAEATIDFFAYSIGAFLTQVMLMDNPQGLLDKSRLFIFCGGPAFNRMSPVRKTILDSEANIALYSFFIEHLDSYLKTDPRLTHYFSSAHSEGLVFRSMIDYNKLIDMREEKLNQISSRLMAVALKKDTVVPYYEVLNTLRGTERSIPIAVKVIDFPFPYSHETPFPLNDNHQSAVSAAVDQVFSMAAEFLN